MITRRTLAMAGVAAVSSAAKHKPSRAAAYGVGHYHWPAEIAYRDVKPAEYAGMFISGGRAPEYLRYDQDLMRITGHFFEAQTLRGFL